MHCSHQLEIKCIFIPVYQELLNSEHFEKMSVSADEDEHSIEMHLPFVAKIMEE